MSKAQDQAKSFIKKYCRVYGSGVSFNKEDGCFCSWLEIESKQENYSKLDWWERNESFSIRLHVQDAITIIEGKIENVLNADSLEDLIIDGIKEMRDTFSFKSECFDTMLSHIGITENECVSVMAELFLDKCVSCMNKSFPVTQRAYDRWVEKGCKQEAKKERIASVFGKDFEEALTNGIASFHDAYIESKTKMLFAFFKQQYGGFTRYTDVELKEKASREAEETWGFWLKFEVIGITDILLRYDVGKCTHYDLQFDNACMKVEGDIFGDTGKRLHFHTIFAGGYNIQCLHTRTIAHVF
jgi:hypothetical protein